MGNDPHRENEGVYEKGDRINVFSNETLVDGRSRSPRRDGRSPEREEDMTGRTWRAETFDPKSPNTRKSRSAERGEREPGRNRRRREKSPPRSRPSADVLDSAGV